MPRAPRLCVAGRDPFLFWRARERASSPHRHRLSVACFAFGGGDGQPASCIAEHPALTPTELRASGTTPTNACSAIERAVTGGERDASSLERIGVAMSAGAISSVLYSPVDLIVIQQQKLGLNSVAGTVRAVTSEFGAAGLMRGFSACVVREAIFTAGYLGRSRQGRRRRSLPSLAGVWWQRRAGKE